jgi:hypothetical protein
VIALKADAPSATQAAALQKRSSLHPIWTTSQAVLSLGLLGLLGRLKSVDQAHNHVDGGNYQR